MSSFSNLNNKKLGKVNNLVIAAAAVVIIIFILFLIPSKNQPSPSAPSATGPQIASVSGEIAPIAGNTIKEEDAQATTPDSAEPESNNIVSAVASQPTEKISTDSLVKQEINDNKKNAADIPILGTPEKFSKGISGENILKKYASIEEFKKATSVAKPWKEPLSGSKPFTIKPDDTLTISGEANAMDKDRTFNINKFTEENLDKLYEEKFKDDFIPYAAYEIDCGLAHNQYLPGCFKLEFNMDECGIPESERKYCKIYCTMDNGETGEMACEINGNIISCQSNHTCAFTVGTVIKVVAYTTAITGAIGVVATQERYACESYPGGEYICCDVNLNAKYSLCFLKSDSKLEKSISEMREELEDKEKQAKQDYIEKTDYDRQSMKQRLNLIKHSSKTHKATRREIAARESKIRNEFEQRQKKGGKDWDINNIWPEEVKRLYKLLVKADNYIYKIRKMPKPFHRVELNIVDRPSGVDSGTYALTDNFKTSFPFISIYKNMEGFRNDTGLLITLTHESLHVLQSSLYCVYDSKSFLPFWEATAVVFEKEGYDYYIKNSIAEPEPKELTEAYNYGDFRYAMMLPGYWNIPSDDKDDIIKYSGYSCAVFLKFLKEKYNLGNNFIPDILGAFRYSWDWVGAAKSITSKSDEMFLADYLAFCLENVDVLSEKQESNYPKVLDLYKKARETPHLFSYRVLDQPIACCADNYSYFDSIYGKRDFIVVVAIGREHYTGNHLFILDGVCTDDNPDISRIMFRKRGLYKVKIRDNEDSENKRLCVMSVSDTLDKHGAEETDVSILFLPAPLVHRFEFDRKDKENKEDDEINFFYVNKSGLPDNSYAHTLTFRNKNKKDIEPYQIDCKFDEYKCNIKMTELLDKMQTRCLADIYYTIRFRVDPFPGMTTEDGKEPEPIFGPESEEICMEIGDFKDLSGVYTGKYTCKTALWYAEYGYGDTYLWPNYTNKKWDYPTPYEAGASYIKQKDKKGNKLCKIKNRHTGKEIKNNTEVGKMILDCVEIEGETYPASITLELYKGGKVDNRTGAVFYNAYVDIGKQFKDNFILEIFPTKKMFKAEKMPLGASGYNHFVDDYYISKDGTAMRWKRNEIHHYYGDESREIVSFAKLNKISGPKKKKPEVKKETDK